MCTLSKLRPLLQSLLYKNNIFNRKMSEHGHRIFPLQASRWQWIKFKDLCYFYAFIGLIPVTIIITYANIFVGPATLSEIPEDYVPKHWEYYRNPISRWLAKYIMHNPQQEYEKFMHYIFEENDKIKLRKLETDIKKRMAKYQDFQSYYYTPVMAKYYRKSREAHEYLESIKAN